MDTSAPIYPFAYLCPSSTSVYFSLSPPPLSLSFSSFTLILSLPLSLPLSLSLSLFSSLLLSLLPPSICVLSTFILFFLSHKCRKDPRHAMFTMNQNEQKKTTAASTFGPKPEHEDICMRRTCFDKMQKCI